MDGLLRAANGNNHFVVVHKKRFVTYHFFRNQVVLKVTTNHIEWVWVEMRKDLRGVKKEDIEDRPREVPYRLLRLWATKFEENQEALIADIRAFVTDQLLANSGSAFRTSRAMEELVGLNCGCYGEKNDKVKSFEGNIH